MQKIHRLIQLNCKLEGIVEFRDSDYAGDAALLGGGTAAGIGGLKLYQGIKKKQAIMPQSGPQLELPGMVTKPTFGQAAKAYARDVPSIARGRATQGWGAVRSLFSKLRAVA